MSTQPSARDRLTRLLDERVLVLDGAMGTMIQSLGLSEADFRGERFADWDRDLMGNNDLLCLTRPDAVEGIPDDPWVKFGAEPTPECDESLVYNQGPSSVRNEFTERYGELQLELETTVDRDRQLQIVTEMESIIAQRVAIIPLYLRPAAYAMRSDIVGGMGFRIRFGNDPEFWNLDHWYLKQLQPGT